VNPEKVPGAHRWFVYLVLGAVLSLTVLAPSREMSPQQSPHAYPIAADAEAERTQSSANFSVTWIHDPASPDAPSLRDTDGDGVPDVLRRLLDAFETARAFLLGNLGYRPPPTTGRYPVYVAGRPGPAVTKALRVVDGQPQPSFIVIPADVLTSRQPSRALRVLAVHEYFHAIQNGYDSGYDHWIGEATAAWMEDVFDDPADPSHYLLREFVPVPRAGLTDVDGTHEYGAFIFIQFLVERYANGNPVIVRELWERMASADSLTAIAAELEERGSTLPRAWSEFLLWRWDLDRFAEGQGYLDALGNGWPEALQTTEVRDESCRLSSDQGSGLPPLSGDYSVFRPARQSGKATLTIEGPPGATAFTLVQKQSGKEKVQLLEIGAEGLASARVRFGSDQVKRVVLGVGNAATTDSDVGFGYSLRVLGQGAVTAEALAPPADTYFFGGLSLRGRVLCDGKPAPSADVVLVQDKRSGEQRTFPLTTSGSGTWFLTFQPEQTSTYHLEVVDPLLSTASSPTWDVGVRVAITLDVPDPDVLLGEPVSVEGIVTPGHPGALVQIDYRRPDLSWRSGPQATLASDGSYQASLTLPASGVWHLRASVVSTGDLDHLGNTTINDVFVTVG
jgi:hypothetical protein